MTTFNHGGEFKKLQLTLRFLQQTQPDLPKGWGRRIPREEIAAFFRGERTKVSCLYPSGTGMSGIFSVRLIGGALWIGCQIFTPQETAQMKRWALPKHRKKAK
jgi:hypothetical protein